MAPEPDFEATFRRAVPNGTVSLSIIRSGQILDLEGVRYEDSLVEEGDWAEGTDDGRPLWWGRYVDGRCQLRRGAGRTIPPQNHSRNRDTNTKVTRRHVRDASSPFLIERDATSDASPQGRRATRIGFRSNCSRTSASSPPLARARVRRPSLVPYAVTREKLRSRSRPINSAARIASQRPDSPTRP
jgi:hypothetical protein